MAIATSAAAPVVLTAAAALLAGLAAAPAGAQEPARRGASEGTVRRVSMEEALRLFGENSLELRIARSERRAARGDARQSRGYFNPSVSVVREDLGRDGEDYWETMAAVEQRVEWPGRTAARSRAAARRIDAAGLAYRSDSLRLAFEVRRAYLRAWAAEESGEALEAAAVVIRDAAAAAARRHEEGDVSGYSLRRLRVERARFEGALAAARLETSAARRTLAALVLPEAEVDRLAPAGAPAGRPPPVARERALEAALERPGVRAAAREVEAAAAAASVARQGWIPSPSLSAGYKDQEDGFSGPVLGVGLALPLFDRSGGAAEAAEARRAAAEAGLALRRREARNDVEAALERYASARRRLSTVADDLLEGTDDLLEIARLAWAEGEMDLVELMDAAGAYRDARVTEVELRADAWIAYHDLIRATGGSADEREER